MSASPMISTTAGHEILNEDLAVNSVPSFRTPHHRDRLPSDPVNVPQSRCSHSLQSHDNEANVCLPSHIGRVQKGDGQIGGITTIKRTLAPLPNGSATAAVRSASILSPELHKDDSGFGTQNALPWHDDHRSRAVNSICPLPTECSTGDDADTVSSYSFSQNPLSATQSHRDCSALSESEDDLWELTPKVAATLLFNDVHEDVHEKAEAARAPDAEARASLVERLRQDRRERFPHLPTFTMDDVRAALAVLTAREQATACGTTTHAAAPSHPFLDLNEQRAHVGLERWQRQTVHQQQQHHAQSLSRRDTLISCKMLAGAAHAHHVDWLRRQHSCGTGLSEEECLLLEDNITFEWARLGQQVEEDLMFRDCATVLRRLSCSCVFDPDSDVRQYGDAEESRTRRVARQKALLKQLEAQKQSGCPSLFLSS